MSQTRPNAAAPDLDEAAREALRVSAARAYRSGLAWAELAVPAVLGLVLDLWTKAVAFPQGVMLGPRGEAPPPQGLNPGHPWSLIANVLEFKTTVNQGAVFGVGQGWVVFFIGFSVVALGLIVGVFASSRREQHVLHIALGLITAGALGNLYDRIVYGAVRDFLLFTVNWYPYIFNIADVLLCVGVPLLMLCWMFAREPGAPVVATAAKQG